MNSGQVRVRLGGIEAFTIPGGRFLELGSPRQLEATSELDAEIKKFRTPFAQEVENICETVAYSLRERNDFMYEGRGTRHS